MPDESGISNERDEVAKLAEFLNDKAWLIVLKPLKHKPRRADMATVVFDCLIEMLVLGEEGQKAALKALEGAIRLLYAYTEESELAYEYYRLCLKTGLADTEDEPVSLLSNAIARLRNKEAEWKRQLKGHSKSPSDADSFSNEVS
ncbi:MAG: hypothetical protein DMF61_09345 [Blastocatellia bacterium AA13]|nr:MAG: hypothetical protein DMF61_09345 [Blastocatellia bacterium AA13]